KVEKYRKALEDWWTTATDGRGSIDTDINRCGTGTTECPGDAASNCEEESGEPDDDIVPDENNETVDTDNTNNETETPDKEDEKETPDKETGETGIDDDQEESSKSSGGCSFLLID
ncbi:MAG: hypothetical protein R6W70_05790, partial [bacterium]